MLSTTFRFRFRSFVGFSTQETFKQVIKLSFNHCCKRHLKLIAIPVSGFVSRNTSGFRSIQTPYLFYHLTKSSNTRPDTRFYWNSIRAGSVLSVSASQRKKIMSGAEDEQNRKKSTKDTTSTATADSDKDGSTSAKRYVTRGNLLHDQKKEVSEAKEKFLSMDKASKRKLYKCKDKYKVLEELESWPQHFCDSLQNDKIMMHWWKTNEKHVKADIHEELNNKMSLFKGDITSLEIDAIANAANESLLGGGGVDGAIHAAAGPRLRSECELLNGCAPGEAKITCGYKLPAKHVIHTVGPRGEQPEVLKNCYVNSLNLMKKNGLQSIAFPCISTGIFGYPNLNAAKVALNTIREWLEKEEEYAQKIERIIMCLFLEVDIKVYNEQMQIYFPVNRAAHKTEESSDPDKQEG